MNYLAIWLAFIFGIGVGTFAAFIQMNWTLRPRIISSSDIEDLEDLGAGLKELGNLMEENQLVKLGGQMKIYCKMGRMFIESNMCMIPERRKEKRIVNS